MNATSPTMSPKAKVKAPPAPRPATYTVPTKPERMKQEELTLEVMSQIFTPTGITAPAEVAPDSTLQIPNSNELEYRKATNINGEAEYQIIRNWEVRGLKPSFDTIIIATADPIEGGKYFGDWARIYSQLTMADRAIILGRKDWVELQQLAIAQSAGRPQTATLGSSYKSKIVLSTTTNPNVTAGVSAAGKKRISWMGHSGFALARYLGKHGWTGAEAVDTFAKIELPMGKSAIIGGVYAGKSGQRGDPAPVTSDQHLILAKHLEIFRLAKAPRTANTAEENKVVEAVRKVSPSKQPLPETAIAAATAKTPAIPTAKKGSKAAKELALANAMTKIHADRKANKATATAKAKATKAAKVK